MGGWEALWRGVSSFAHWQVWLWFFALLGVRYVLYLLGGANKDRSVGPALSMTGHVFLQVVVMPMFLASVAGFVTHSGAEIGSGFALEHFGSLLLAGLLGLILSFLVSLIPIVNVVTGEPEIAFFIAAIPVTIHLAYGKSEIFSRSVEFVWSNLGFLVLCALFVWFARHLIIVMISTITARTGGGGRWQRPLIGIAAPMIGLIPVFSMLNLAAHEAALRHTEPTEIISHILEKVEPRGLEEFDLIVEKAHQEPLTLADIEHVRQIWDDFLTQIGRPLTSQEKDGVRFLFLGPWEAAVAYDRWFAELLLDALENQHTPEPPKEFFDLQEFLVESGKPTELVDAQMNMLWQVGLQNGMWKQGNNWYRMDALDIALIQQRVDMRENNLNRIVSIMK